MIKPLLKPIHTAVDGINFDPIGAITDPIQQFILVIDKTGLGQQNYTGSFVKVGGIIPIVALWFINNYF